MSVTWRSILAAIALCTTEVSLKADEQPLVRGTVTWKDGHRSALAADELKRSVLEGRWPDYPVRARLSKLRGSGVYEIQFDSSGAAIQVRVVKSAIHRVLDEEAVDTFKRWRVRPGTIARIEVPVTWKLNPF